LKKICINGKFFGQQITGTQRYARELIGQLDCLLSSGEQQISMEVLVPKDARSIPQYTNLRVRTVGRTSGTLWEQVELPKYCKGDILFTPSGGAPALHPRNVVTIHDAAVCAVPGGYSLVYRLWYRNLCRRVAQTAEHIFTVSDFSKSEIVKWYRAIPENVTVTYLGSEHFFRLEADHPALTRFGIPGKYILAVGSHNPNKNFHRIVEAARHVGATGAHLVVAGGYDNRVYRERMSLPDSVRVLGYVSDSELKALYESAECFVFASLYEGFGLPALEALSSGCPVVVSHAASLPELFGGAACFCDPYEVEDIAAAIEQAIKLRRGRTDHLKAFARKFSWEKCAREILEVLRSL
jgi:glycosyltransferase involved in cell wall biosynthesis